MKRKIEEEVVGYLDVIENDVKRAGVSVENEENRVKWKLRTKVADSKQFGKKAKESKKYLKILTIN